MGERESEERTPRWVKVFGAVTLLLIVLFVVVLVTQGGDHGPRRHATAAASVALS